MKQTWNTIQTNLTWSNFELVVYGILMVVVIVGAIYGCATINQ